MTLECITIRRFFAICMKQAARGSPWGLREATVVTEPEL